MIEEVIAAPINVTTEPEMVSPGYESRRAPYKVTLSQIPDRVSRIILTVFAVLGAFFCIYVTIYMFICASIIIKSMSDGLKSQSSKDLDPGPLLDHCTFTFRSSFYTPDVPLYSAPIGPMPFVPAVSVRAVSFNRLPRFRQKTTLTDAPATTPAPTTQAPTTTAVPAPTTWWEWGLGSLPSILLGVDSEIVDFDSEIARFNAQKSAAPVPVTDSDGKTVEVADMLIGQVGRWPTADILAREQGNMLSSCFAPITKRWHGDCECKGLNCTEPELFIIKENMEKALLFLNPFAPTKKI